MCAIRFCFRYKQTLNAGWRSLFGSILSKSDLFAALLIFRIRKTIVSFVFTSWFPLKLFFVSAVHEKLFITFMISSLTHMLACIKATKKVAETRNDLVAIRRGLRIKQGLFIVSLLSTVGLVGFFLEHRLLCHDMGKFFRRLCFVCTNSRRFAAFSWFAFCEYVIASANMAFHVTVILDFPTEQLLVAKDALNNQQMIWKVD